MSEWLDVAKWSWVYTAHGKRLHHLAKPENLERIDDDWWASGFASCGLWSTFFLPGIMSRMGLERCARCCDVLGWPRGTGSPKNDDALRALVEAGEAH